MGGGEVRFSISAHAAWAPRLTSTQAWSGWATDAWRICGSDEPPVAAMPALLRRRAGFLGKMALEAAYQCLGERSGIPSVFVSRHGDVGRAIELLGDLAHARPLSPTAFGLSVHNAAAGLLSIARLDRAHHVALAAGAASAEHGVIEACGLLADGADSVLLVCCDCPLPDLLSPFQDCDEQPFAWAWLMTRPGAAALSLGWSAAAADSGAAARCMPGGLEVLRFQLGGHERLERRTPGMRWLWSRHG